MGEEERKEGRKKSTWGEQDVTEVKVRHSDEGEKKSSAFIFLHCFQVNKKNKIYMDKMTHNKNSKEGPEK